MIDDVIRTPVAIPEGVASARSTPLEVAETLSEYVDLRDRHREADREAVVFAHGLEQLEAQEIKASADALRAGRPAPKSALPKKRQELADREREVAVLRVATEDAFRALERVVGIHRQAWALELDGLAQARREALVAAVDALEAADRELRTALAAKAWVVDFPASRLPKPARVGQAGLRKPSNEPYQAAQLIDGLRTYAAGERAMPAAAAEVGVPSGTGALPVG